MMRELPERAPTMPAGASRRPSRAQFRDVLFEHPKAEAQNENTSMLSGHVPTRFEKAAHETLVQES